MADPTIGNLILENGAVAAECARLKAENDRLREALEDVLEMWSFFAFILDEMPAGFQERSRAARKALERTNG